MALASTIFTVFAVLSSLLLIYLLGRRNEGSVRRDWDMLLTPQGEKLYRMIEGRVHNEMALADMTYDEAFSVRELGSVDDAKHLLHLTSSAPATRSSRSSRRT